MAVIYKLHINWTKIPAGLASKICWQSLKSPLYFHNFCTNFLLNFGRFWKLYRNYILLGLLNLSFYSCQRLESPQFSNSCFVCSMYVWLYVCQVFTTPRANAFSSAPKLVMKLFKPLKLPLTLGIGTLMHWSIGALVHQYNILHIEAACIHFSYHPNTK